MERGNRAPNFALPLANIFMRSFAANKTTEAIVVGSLRKKAYALSEQNDLDPLMKRIGNARIVMLGEASHGTHEYYTWRSHISKRLITEKGFNFIAVEGDWPDCFEVNSYIKSGGNSSSTSIDVLKTFRRWPTWMWSNWEIAALVTWLKQHNSGKPSVDKTGFYGLDVYSLWDSMEAVIKYLQTNEPSAVEAAMEAYRCFEPHKGEDGYGYARALQFVPQTCEDEVVALLKKLREHEIFESQDKEARFSAEQNALISVNAEKYYRAMLSGGAESWNVRDMHMNETLERLLDLYGPGSKAIVWEHNTHIGDASATDMAEDGMTNIGELSRSIHSNNVLLVGFGSYEGTVMAGKSWGAQMQTMKVPPARAGSWEYYLHKANPGNQLLVMDDFNEEVFNDSFDHRAIGVVYNPAYERFGNYVPSVMPKRYDAFIYIDHTKALHPLNTGQARELEAPATYPFGM